MQNIILNNKYELLSKVGAGGMSVVYLARDLTLNKNWAIKEVMKEGLLKGQRTQNDLLTEAKMMKNLDHPSLPRIVDIIEETDRYYIVMDYVEGETLQDIIDRKGPQSQQQVIKWGLELAAVLYYLHSLEPPIIYRDMKPANVILQPNGSLKVIDFGIARTYEATKTEDTVALGSKGFAAPEQYYNSGRVTKSDVRTDVFNLGATMYTLLTTKTLDDKPYKFVPIRTIDPDFSAGLEKILIKATQQNPDDRFQTAEELMQALLNFEKLDDEYINSHKRTLKKTLIPLIAGIVFMIAGCGGLAANHVVDKNTYEKLILDTGDREQTIENLSKAISLRPQEPKGYEVLIAELAEDEDGLTEEDSALILSIYNENKGKVKAGSTEALDIDFTIGQNYLVYFTGASDNSVRNRLLTAYPFFDSIYQSGQEDYENYQLAKSYAMLGDFYKEFIIGGDSMFTKDAGKKEYEALIRNMKEAIQSVDDAQGSNVQLRLITYATIANILDTQKSGITYVIPQDEVIGLLGTISKKTEQLQTENEKAQMQKEALQKQIEITQEGIQTAYENRRKEGGAQ